MLGGVGMAMWSEHWQYSRSSLKVNPYVVQTGPLSFFVPFSDE